MVAINKWDAIEKDTHSVKAFETALERHLPFLEFVPRVFISAKTGQRVEKLFEVVQATFDNFNRRVPTWQFNKWLMALQQRVQAPTHRGRKLKMSYGAQLSVRPPKFVIIVNQLGATKASYQRFVVAQIRETWQFDGSPIRLEFKKKQSKRKRTATQVTDSPVVSTGDETLDLLLGEAHDDPETRALQASLLQPDDDDEFYEDDDAEAEEPAQDDLAGDWDDDNG